MRPVVNVQRTSMRAIFGAGHLLASALLATALLWSGAARAQIETLDQSLVEDPRNPPAHRKYVRIDPHQEAISYLVKVLPTGWWTREADYRAGHSITLEVHLPDGWRGNPTTALMRFCPPPKHKLWRYFKEVDLRPVLDDRRRTSYVCYAS